MIPSAAVSSRGGRENPCSDTSDQVPAAPAPTPHSLGLSLSRTPSGPPRWPGARARPQARADFRAHGPQAPTPRTWGHFLHLRLRPKCLHLCLVLPFESINYLKQGKKGKKNRGPPCPSPSRVSVVMSVWPWRPRPRSPLVSLIKSSLSPSIQRPFSRGGAGPAWEGAWGHLARPPRREPRRCCRGEATPGPPPNQRGRWGQGCSRG